MDVNNLRNGICSSCVSTYTLLVGASAQIKYFSHNNLFDGHMYILNIIPFVAILGLSALYSLVFNKEFKLSIPPVISLIILILYPFASLNFAYFGILVIYFLGILSWFYVLKYKAFAMKLKSNKNSILAYLSIVLFFAIFYRGTFLSSWDDFTFWGVATKELIFRGGFERLGDATSILDWHIHYPRAASIFHYFFTLLNDFDEGSILFAHFILYFSFFISLIDENRIAKSSFMLLLSFGIVCLMSSALRSLYNDGLIAVIFVSSIILFLESNDKKKAIVDLVPIAMVLPLFKEVGFIIAIILGFIIGLVYFRFEYKKDSNLKSSMLIRVFLLLLSPLMGNLIQMMCFDNSGLVIGRPEHSMENIASVFPNFDLEIVIGFFKLLGASFFKEGQILSYILIFSAYYFTKSKDKFNEEFCALLKYLAISLVALIIWRLYINIFIFKWLSNGSLNRYLSTIEIAFPIISIYYLGKIFFEGEMGSKTKIFVWISSIIALVLIYKSLDRVPNFLSPQEEIYQKQLSEVRELLKNGKKVEIRYDNKKGDLECHQLAFYLAPYLNGSEIKNCRAKEEKHHNLYTGKLKILPKIEDNCNIIYYPFLMDYGTECYYDKK